MFARLRTILIFLAILLTIPQETQINTMVSLSDIKERAQQAVSSDSDDSDGRIDQAEARVQRARQEALEEARKEAQREQVQQRVQQAREEAREEGRAAVEDTDESDTESKGTLAQVADVIETATEQVADADGLAADDIDAAMGTDFDDDGEPLAGELGLQTNDRAAVENDAFGTLGERVTENEQGIASLESEVFGSQSQRQAADSDPMSPGGFGAGFGGVGGAGGGLGGVAADEEERLEQMGFDPDNESGL
jgi:chromosome segregation ATPase